MGKKERQFYDILSIGEMEWRSEICDGVSLIEVL
jgi:hypothetical protein